VRELIDQRGLRPGDRLPSERELARHLGVGRTSVREGLRSLELLGLLEVVPGKGIYLRCGAGEPFERAVRDWLAAHEGTLRELVELREAVETQAARLAARRASASDLAALERALGRMADATEAGDVEAFVASDTAFHDAVACASGNGLVRRSLASIARETIAFRTATASVGRWVMERTHAEHEAVYRAIAAADVGAASNAMREHILVWTAQTQSEGEHHVPNP
jgi:DNA-binding FadR family transcriptional regulator